MTKSVEMTAPNLLQTAFHAENKADRVQAVNGLMSMVHDDRCPRRIPAILLALPWDDSSDEIQLRIAANMLLADDPDDISTESKLPGLSEFVGRVLRIWDFRVRPSNIEDGWGAYILADCSLDTDDERFPVAIGSPQAVTRLARAYALREYDPANNVPLVCEVVEVAQAKQGRNAPLGLRVEKAF